MSTFTSTRLITVAAIGAVIAGIAAAPASAIVTTHGQTRGAGRISYVRVGRAPRLPAGARRLGVTSGSKRISGAVALAPRDPVALEAAATAASDPRSPSYHHYLDKGGFAAAYGPSAATIDAVKSTLSAAHLTVTSVSSNGLLVHFAGTAAQAGNAFRTRLATYRLAGHVGTQTTTSPSFPASIAPAVVGVIGLDTVLTQSSDFKHTNQPAQVKAVTHKFARPAGSASACPAARETAAEIGGLTDDQITHQYGVDGLYSNGDLGQGQTIALYELEPFSMTDVAAFDSCYYGAHAATTMAGRISLHPVDGGAGVGSGEGEAILDVEDLSGVAPDANIEVYSAPNSTAAALDEYNQMVQDDSASVISTSWGRCESDMQASDPGAIAVENTIFEQAALQGQTVFSAAGDAGSDDCSLGGPTTPQLTVDDPSSQPFVTAVGGTTTTDSTSRPDEQVWNDGATLGAGGGGVSSIWGAPSWQQPVVDSASAARAVADGAPPCAQSANGGLCRELPDVSAQADELTGSITVYAAEFHGWITAGGTSSATPLWAAMLAEVNASAGCVASGDVGFASPALYAVASTPVGYAASFNDLTAGHGDNDLFDAFEGKDFATRAGYDMASGLGSPRLGGANGKAGLAAYLCALGTTPATTRPVIGSLSKTEVDTTPTGTLTLTGTGFTGATAVSIGGYAVPSADWSVTGPTTIAITSIPTAALAGTGGAGPQDGSGRAPVVVTGANGTTSLLSASAMLIYVDGTGSALPSVSGVQSFGGTDAGGNTVTVFGSGFGSVPISATVGGVAATNVHVIAPNHLTMTVPAYLSGTTGCATGDDAVADDCQAQVVVTNANGSSATSVIKPSYTGEPFYAPSNGQPYPDCFTAATCEIAPASTEYDYLPAPHISSVVTTTVGATQVWAGEEGDTLATINGTGFDPQSLLGAAIGSRVDPEILSVTPTSIQLVLLGHRRTSAPVAAKLAVKTLAGVSNASTLTYAGIPRVSKLAPRAGPEVGGTTVHITGTGFQGASPADGGEIGYINLNLFAVTAQLSGYTVKGGASITATTPQSTAGDDFVSVCTISACSEPSFRALTSTSFDYFAPGDPVVTSVHADSGPASGGNLVRIRGHNLSGLVSVHFAKAVAAPDDGGLAGLEGLDPIFLADGSATMITAIAPPGRAGSTVPVTVTTTESTHGGASSTVTTASHYHYFVSAPAAPRALAIHRHGTTLGVIWKAPASDGGRAITSYRVSAIALSTSRKPGAKLPPTVAVTTTSRARVAHLRGLRGGWSYLVTVRAVNRKGRGRLAVSPRPLLIRQAA
jgi:hypothetical protein